MNDDLFSVLARLTLGGVWIVAAIAKLAMGRGRSTIVEQFTLLRGAPARAVGLVLPILELVLGLLVLTGIGLQWAAAVSAVTLAAFSIVLVQALIRGQSIRCNCFGTVSDAELGWGSAVRNAGLLALAIFLARWPSDYLTLPSLAQPVARESVAPTAHLLVPALLIWMAAGAGLLLLNGVLRCWRTALQGQGGPGWSLAEVRWLARLERASPASDDRPRRLPG
jgi:hypothetical protein